MPLIPIALLATLGCGQAAIDTDAVTRAIGREVGTTIVLARNTGSAVEPTAARAAVARFYQSRGLQLAWFDDQGEPTAAAIALVERLASAGEHGLDPRLYAGASQTEPQTYATAAADTAATGIAERDVALTRAFLELGSHLSGGRLDPQEIRLNWYADDQLLDVYGALERAVADGGVDRELDALAPTIPAYASLRSALAKYRELALAGGWPQVPDPRTSDSAAAPAATPAKGKAKPDDTLRLGSQGVAVAALRQRLAATGELAETFRGDTPGVSSADGAAPAGAAQTPALFDETLAQAVRAFQDRHGLEPTGEVDTETRDALNVPVEDRIRTLELNLERWRWLPPSLGDRYLQVNVPAFELEAIESDAPVLRMRVVVGKPISQTPVLSDTMTYLVINPFWNVPASIARNEILPKLQSDPGYLSRENFEIEHDERGRPQVRQRPGAGNALGRIKFMFPNHLNIYLHDTPADHLFARKERDFSHGCIRVEDPLALAQYVLRGNSEWDTERITTTIATGRTVDVKLPEPLPVHVMYWTAWVDAEGRVQFRDDLYGKDRVLDQALRGAGRAPAVSVASG